MDWKRITELRSVTCQGCHMGSHSHLTRVGKNHDFNKKSKKSDFLKFKSDFFYLNRIF